MTIEERLRRALHAEAAGVDPDPAAWQAVQDEVARRRGGRARQRAGVGVLALAAVAAIALGVVTLLGDDDSQRVDAGPSADAPSTTEAETPPGQDAFTGIWPFASRAEVEAYMEDPGDGTFFDAYATALEFAREYLGMPDPQVGVARGFSEVSRLFFVAPKPGSPFTTRIGVGRVSVDDPWTVGGASADNIQVDVPESGDVVAGEVRVRGRSTAFEGTVQVEVREDGQTFGERLGQSYVTGGSMGDLAPFEGTIGFDPPTEPAGAVVFFTSSAEDGTVQEATVVRVAFSREETTSFSVFFHRGEELVEIERTVPKTTGVLRAALTSLFEGPRPQDGEVSSFFSAETAELLGDVNIRDDGTAVVDLAGTVPNANTSAGSQAFLASLNATVFQFSTVDRVEYRLNSSCDAFWEWLQYGDCQVVPRT